MTSGDSYVVIQTNPAQTYQAHENTHEAWDLNLTQEKFHERENLLGRCKFAQDNLYTYALVKSGNPETLDLLSHLEVFLRPALVRYPKIPTHIDKVQAASVASVFTPSKYRNRGFAKRLLLGVLELFRKQGITISNLYSDIGPDLYSKLGWRVYSPKHLQIEVSEKNTGTSVKNVKVQVITEGDVLTELVQQDCELLEKEFISNPHSDCDKPEVLLLPSEPVYHWFWERSNFYATEVENKAKISRLGVYVPNTPYFAIWYPDYLEKCLTVLRIRLPEENPNPVFQEFMHLAKEEAKANELTHVTIWNLNSKVWKGHQEEGVEWVTRTGALPSMAWIPDLNREVEWYHNEKFCWV